MVGIKTKIDEKGQVIESFDNIERIERIKIE